VTEELGVRICALIDRAQAETQSVSYSRESIFRLLLSWVWGPVVGTCPGILNADTNMLLLADFDDTES